MSDLTKSELLNILKKADIANLNKNLLTLNSIKDFKVNNNEMKLTVSIPLPAEQISNDIKNKISDVLKKELPYVAR